MGISPNLEDPCYLDLSHSIELVELVEGWLSEK